MKIYNIADYKIGEGLREDAKPILEVNRNLDLGGALRIKGELYYGCIRSKYCLFVRKLNVLELNDEPEELTGENEIKCPYCEGEIPDSWEMPDEDDDYECLYCKSYFSYQRIVEVTYDSRPKKKGIPIELE